MPKHLTTLPSGGALPDVTGLPEGYPFVLDGKLFTLRGGVFEIASAAAAEGVALKRVSQSPIFEDYLLEKAFTGVDFPTVLPAGWLFKLNGAVKAPSDTDWGAFGQQGFTYSSSGLVNSDTGTIEISSSLNSSTLKSDAPYVYSVEFPVTATEDLNLTFSLDSGAAFNGSNQEFKSYRFYVDDVEVEGQRRTGKAEATDDFTDAGYLLGVTNPVDVPGGQGLPVVLPLVASPNPQVIRVELVQSAAFTAPPGSASLGLSDMALLRPGFKTGDLIYSDTTTLQGTFLLSGVDLLPVSPRYQGWGLFRHKRLNGYYNGVPPQDLTYGTVYRMLPDFVSRRTYDELGNAATEDATVAEPANRFEPVGMSWDAATGVGYVASGKVQPRVYMDITGMVAGDIMRLVVNLGNYTVERHIHFYGQATVTYQEVFPEVFCNGNNFSFDVQVLNGTSTAVSTFDIAFFEFEIPEVP